MKKVIFLLSLFSILTVQYGCESHHRDSDIQEEQEKTTVQDKDIEKTVPDRGGNAGNR